MRKIILPIAAISAAILTPAAANAQRGGILVVDTSEILRTCTACQAAGTQLQAQAQQLQQRAQQLEAELKPERDAIQQAVAALNGRQPDAALRQRAEAFAQREQAARTELANRRNTFDSTNTNVQRQVGERLVQVAEQVRARRQATIVVGKDALLANDNSIDVTSEVLQALNQQLPSVSVTPLPQQQQQQQAQPQGR